MIRNTILGSLLALVAAHAAPAQHVSIGFGPGGVRLHAELGRGPRDSCREPVTTGHWEVRRERVWVEGCERVVHVPPRFEWRWDACGRRMRVCVSPGYDRVVREPGRWEWRERRVWVERRHRW